MLFSIDWGFCDVADDMKNTKSEIDGLVKLLNARGIMILIKCKQVNREVDGSSPSYYLPIFKSSFPSVSLNEKELSWLLTQIGK